MARDEVRCTGQVLVEFINEAGEVVSSQRLENKVVRTGREHLVQLMNMIPGINSADYPVPPDMRYIAVGSSNAATTDDMVGLVTEFKRVSVRDRIRNGNSITYVAVFDNSFSGLLAELGIFNSAESKSGTMLARVVANSPQTKATSSTVQITWTISLNS